MYIIYNHNLLFTIIVDVSVSEKNKTVNILLAISVVCGSCDYVPDHNIVLITDN